MFSRRELQHWRGALRHWRLPPARQQPMYSRTLTHAGDHIVAAKNIYGGTYNLLAHTSEYGVTKKPSLTRSTTRKLRTRSRRTQKAIHIETLGNPNSDVVDIESWLPSPTHRIPLVVDNTFATPYLVKTDRSTAQISYSIPRQNSSASGTTIGGVIIDSGNFDWEASGKFPSLVEPNPSLPRRKLRKGSRKSSIRYKNPRDLTSVIQGATISPFHAFIFLQGLEDTVSPCRAPCTECPEGR